MERAATATAAGRQAEAGGDYRAAFAAADKAALAELEHGWGEAYQIGVYERGGWWWRRRDKPAGVEKADSPDQVQAAIVADYARRPVRRADVDVAEQAAISREFPAWHIWRSNHGRWWGTRRGNARCTRRSDARWAMTIDAATPDRLRAELQAQESYG